MDPSAFKRASRRLVLELIVVVVLAFPTVPTGLSAGQAWRFVGRHPTLDLHVGLGVAILVEAAALLARCARGGRWVWRGLAATGLALVLLAAAGGVLTVRSQQHAAVDLMAAGWFCALVGYGIGWSLGHRLEARTIN